MKTYRIQQYVAKEKEIFVGLEDSKRTWKLAVRCEKMVIHQTSMDAKYPVLIGYLRNKFPDGSRKKAIVAVARMLIVRYRACMLAGTPYVIGVAA